MYIRAGSLRPGDVITSLEADVRVTDVVPSMYGEGTYTVYTSEGEGATFDRDIALDVER